MPRPSIAELLAVPAEEQDLEWLENSLQSAIALEFSTLPIYLSGMWSIEQQSGDAYNLIKSVVMEEMLHMGLACNMLVAIGGQPDIVATTYPSQGLPGGVLPDLEVYLAGLSPATLEMYMAIEQPEEGATDHPTIGQFYDTVSAAFASLSPPISTTHQVTATVGVPDPDNPADPGTISEKLTKLASLDDVQNAIALIKDQGEGTSTSPDAPQFDPPDGELAHYFRFGEILTGHQLEQQPDGSWQYTGPAIEFPACYPVAKVPAGGYPGVQAVEAFDTSFSTLIQQLNSAWSGGSLGPAIGTMFGLYDLAQPIVQTPLGGGQNYGPDFVPSNASDTAGKAMAVSFKTDILPLFIQDDIEHMSGQGVDLGDYTYMSDPTDNHANAQAVYVQVSTGSMPIDNNGNPVRTWSSDKVALFQSWMDGGYQP
jgi:ferritin-like protein